MSSVLQIERQFKKLDKKHKHIINFYDIRSKGKKHRFIKDIHEDYEEDKQIYGYSRFDIQNNKKDAKVKKPPRKRPTNQPKITDDERIPSISSKRPLS